MHDFASVALVRRLPGWYPVKFLFLAWFPISQPDALSDEEKGIACLVMISCCSAFFFSLHFDCLHYCDVPSLRYEKEHQELMLLLSSNAEDRDE